MAASLLLQLAIALRYPQAQIGLTDSQWDKHSPFVIAYLAGLFGGALFSTKWLYHSVARGYWHCDRILWRIFTPMLSGGVGLTVVLLCAGKVIPLFGAELVRTNAGAAGVAVLVGYFSDRTFSSLENLAETHLGSVRSKNDADAEGETNSTPRSDS
jgi:hypothetical protein